MVIFVLTEGFLLADDMPIAKDVAGKLVISSGYTNSVFINRQHSIQAKSKRKTPSITGLACTCS